MLRTKNTAMNMLTMDIFQRQTDVVVFKHLCKHRSAKYNIYHKISQQI